MDKLTPGQVAQVLREVRDCFGATVSVMRRIDQLQDEEAARREDQESAEPFKSCNDCTSPLTCHNQQFCPTAKGRAQLGNGPVGLMRLGQTPGAVSGPTVPNGEREGLDSAATPPAADELVFDKAAADRAAKALIPDAPDGVLAYQLAIAKPDPNDPNWPLPSFDARDWAKAFCERNPGFDEGTALSWFANALMRGYDEHARQHSAAQKRVAELKAALAKVQELKRDASPIVLAVYRELVAVGNAAADALKGADNG